MRTELENLKERLSSPRKLPIPGDRGPYLKTARRFLNWLGEKEPTDSDFRHYFIYRREHKIAERILRTEFFHLKVLTLANGWVWPFSARDVPLENYVAEGA